MRLLLVLSAREAQPRLVCFPRSLHNNTPPPSSFLLNHNPPPTKLEPAPHLHSKIKFPHATTLLSNSNTFKSISPHTVSIFQVPGRIVALSRRVLQMRRFSANHNHKHSCWYLCRKQWRAKELVRRLVSSHRNPLLFLPEAWYSSARNHLELRWTAYLGNSKPRIFPTVAETTTTKRATANTGAKRGPKKATATKASKPVGVKKAAPAKKTSVATKVRSLSSHLSHVTNVFYRLRVSSRKSRGLLPTTQQRRYCSAIICYDPHQTRLKDPCLRASPQPIFNAMRSSSSDEGSLLCISPMLFLFYFP